MRCETNSDVGSKTAVTFRYHRDIKHGVAKKGGRAQRAIPPKFLELDQARRLLVKQQETVNQQKKGHQPKKESSKLENYFFSFS